MDRCLTNRGLAWSVILLFGLFLLWQFFSEATTALLTIIIGLLLAVALSPY